MLKVCIGRCQEQKPIYHQTAILEQFHSFEALYSVRPEGRQPRVVFWVCKEYSTKSELNHPTADIDSFVSEINEVMQKIFQHYAVTSFVVACINIFKICCSVQGNKHRA